VTRGLGRWAPGPSQTASAVRELLASPAELARASEACRRAARPQAAIEIADAVAECLVGAGGTG